MKFELEWVDFPKNVANHSPELLIPINGIPTMVKCQLEN